MPPRSPSGADLHAIVNPNGLATNAWFEYWENPGIRKRFGQPVRGSGTDNVNVISALTGLDFATKYYYRIVARNSTGDSVGSTLNFTTAGGVPVVTTKQASSITSGGAVLNATVNPSGLATYAWFEYGDNTAMGNIWDNQSRGSGTDNVNIATPALTGLKENTTYYYRIVATNTAGGPVYGDTFTFPTLKNPPPTADAGLDQSVYTRSASGPTTVTLDASGSTDPYGTIISYAWTQLSGATMVDLDNSALATPSFTVPQFGYFDPPQELLFEVTVTDDRGLSDTKNVKVTVNWGFFDDFSTDTTSTYTVAKDPVGNPGSLTYDAPDADAYVTTGPTGAGNTVQITHLFDFGPGNNTDTAVFTMDVWPTSVGAGGGVKAVIGEGTGTYIKLSSYEDVVEKWVGDALIDSQPLTGNPTLNVNNTIRIEFTRSVTTVTAFGETVTLGGGDNRIPAMIYFSVATKAMNAYYDNFKLEVHP